MNALTQERSISLPSQRIRSKIRAKATTALRKPILRCFGYRLSLLGGCRNIWLHQNSIYCILLLALALYRMNYKSLNVQRTDLAIRVWSKWLPDQKHAAEKYLPRGWCNAAEPMLLLASLFFFARTLNGHPTPSSFLGNAYSSTSILRRAAEDSNLPNPETGLCDCPDMRTLRDIIWSCATTLILSAWVSVHFNVQPLRLSPFRRAMIRFGTLSAAILGPELAVFWAYREWSTSRKIDRWFKDKCASFRLKILTLCFLTPYQTPIGRPRIPSSF